MNKLTELDEETNQAQLKGSSQIRVLNAIVQRDKGSRPDALAYTATVNMTVGFPRELRCGYKALTAREHPPQHLGAERVTVLLCVGVLGTWF